jgi:hypothetical protein
LSVARGFWLAGIALAATSTAGAESHCDPSLAPSTNHPYKYVARGDRCEGVYIQLVGSTPLKLLSFTSAFGAFDPQAGQPLTIEWSAPKWAPDVQLRALSMRRHFYYRMDTGVGAGGTRYRWPTDVLSAVKLGRAEIGLIGWTRRVVGGDVEDVLLPLAASQSSEQRSTGPYTLLVQSATELSDLYLTITRLADDGGAEHIVQPSRELGYGYYPAENAIEIPIDAPTASGLYAVQLGARLRSGGTSTLRFVFYAPAR